MIQQPTLIRELIAGPQIERIYSGIYDDSYLSAYLNYLDSIADKKIRSLQGEVYEKVFISRAKLPSRSRIVGEKILCEIFEQNGFKVIYPEELSVIEQLRIYSNAKILIFTEGSALHPLQLLGRVQANVYVITRRKNYTVAKWQLTPRVSKLVYMDTVISNQPRVPYYYHLVPSFINFKELFKRLRDEGLLSSDDYSDDLINKKIMEDLEDIILYHKYSKQPHSKEILDYINEEAQKVLGVDKKVS